MSSLTTFVAGNVLTAAQLNNSFAAVGGLRPVDCTSVTVTGAGSSGSAGTNGKITFGTAESVSVNGVFSATFTNYLLIADFDSSAASMDTNLRLRVGGADNSTASSYVRQQINANDTTLAGARVTTNLWRVGPGASVYTNGFSAYLYRPFAADTTAYTSTPVNSELNAYLTVMCGTHNQNTSYDGFTLLASTGNITGTVTVYGLFG